jgi:hypothetical protein
MKALMKIDTEAYTNATRAAESTATNTPPVGPGEGAVKAK